MRVDLDPLEWLRRVAAHEPRQLDEGDDITARWLRELIAWGASAPDPEDVADDVTDYMRWLERRPAAATRQAALDALAQAAQDDGQYDPLPLRVELTTEEAAEQIERTGEIVFEVQPDGSRVPVRYLKPSDRN